MTIRVLFLFIFFPVFSIGQSNNSINKTITSLDTYSLNYPEKIYIQTDKPYYSLGDDIWFSAFLVNGISHTKSKLSHVIHVELINDKDNIVANKELFTDDISVAGDFKIRNDWKEGYYTIRAYTNYMRNFDQDYFFRKNIRILNANTITDDLKHNTKPIDKPEVSFYPEGGYLINGIKSKIGIKVKGIGEDTITGFIKDSDNNIIMNFKTYEYGLGLVALTPDSQKSYYAIINYKGQEYSYSLPKALTSGYHLQVENKDNSIIVSATSNTYNGLDNSFLIAHQRGKLLLQKDILSKEINHTLKFDASSLPDGVITFVLFDELGRPVSERLVFITNPNNNIITKVNRNKSIYSKREKVKLNIGIRDILDKPQTGKLSLAITDMNIIDTKLSRENIKTYLLLNSDLRGHIKNPTYFFEDSNDIKRKYLLDLVMLTHGWRRYRWKEIETLAKTSRIFAPEKGKFIKGHTSKLKETGKRITALTRLTFKGYELEQEHQKTDANGNFNYGPYKIEDSIAVLLEARIGSFNDKSKNNRTVSISIDNNTQQSAPVKPKSKIETLEIKSDMLSDYLDHSKNTSILDAQYEKNARLLDEVLIVAKKQSEQQKREEFLDEKAEYGFPTQRLDLNNKPETSSLSVLTLLRYLPGVRVTNDSVTIRNRVPRIIVDGLTYEPNDLSNLTGNEVEFIDLLTGADAAFFSDAANGIIVIHLKEGINTILKNIKRSPGIINFVAKGYYTAREFYSPNYADDFEDVTKPDFRSTLYWNPKINLTTSNPETEIEFFTGDVATTYHIKIEGLTDSGIPVVYFSTFQVD